MSTTRRNFIKDMMASGIALSSLTGRGLEGFIPETIYQPSSLKETFRESLIVDNLGGFFPALSLPDYGFEMLEKSGLNIGNIEACSIWAEESLKSMLKRFSLLTSITARFNDRMMLIRNFSDIVAMKENKKYGFLLGAQTADAIEPHLNNLKLLYDYGLRQVQLTHNWRNYFGDGCTERSQAGLSDFGIELVEKMNELGMIVDVAHCCYKTTMDAIEASKKPIVFSHTNCKALCDHARNKTDEEIKALARKGGVMGIVFFNWFISDKPRSDLEDLLDHFDHVIRLVGPEHVGIGSDFGVYPYSTDPGQNLWQTAYMDTEREGSENLIEGVYSESEYKALKGRDQTYLEELNGPHLYWTVAQGLKRRGHSLTDIQKILGLNFIRVFKAILKP